MYNKNELEKLNIDITRLKLKNNILNLVYEVCEQKKYLNNHKLFNETLNINSQLNSYIIQLRKILEKDLNNREEYIKNLTQLKEKILKHSNVIFAHLAFIAITEELLSKEINIKQIKEIEESTPFSAEIARDLIIDYCQNYINFLDSNSKHQFENLFRKSDLLSCFDLNMTRQKYEDYIKNSFQLLFANLSKTFVDKSIKILKYFDFVPFLIENPENLYKESFDIINNIFNENLKSKSVDELKNLLDKLDDNYNNVNLTMDFLETLYSNTNYLINISSFCIDSNFIFEDDFEIKDLYYSACNILDSAENEYLIDDVKNIAEEKIEYLYNKIKQEENKFKKITKNIQDKTEEIKNYIKIQETLNDNFFAKLDRNYFYETEENNLELEPVTKEYIQNKAEEFIKEINCIRDKIGNKKLKIIKQLFIKNLPCPFNNNEIADYIEFSTEDVNNLLYISLSNIIDFFEEVGFEPDKEIS